MPLNSAPPYYTTKRAYEVLMPAFRRAVEFITYERIPGPVCEFGVWNGFSAKLLAELIISHQKDEELWLFDSFEGMPEITSEIDAASPERQRGAWEPGSRRAALTPEQIRCHVAYGRCKVIPGWFKDTVAELPTAPSLVHFDCDLYQSTKDVLDRLKFQSGMVLLFDDWNCGRASDCFGQRAALIEWHEANPYWQAESWFSYGWHGQSFLIHAVLP